MLNFILYLLKSRLVRFSIIGAIGFFIEAAFLTYFVTQTTIGPMYGRLFSFPAAVLVTWGLNRKITFQSDNSPGSESLRYFTVQLVGALCNLGLFFVLVSSISMLAQEPVLPLFLAAILGLSVNFTLSRNWVFKKNERIK